MVGQQDWSRTEPTEVLKPSGLLFQPYPPGRTERMGWVLGAGVGVCVHSFCFSSQGPHRGNHLFLRFIIAFLFNWIIKDEWSNLVYLKCQVLVSGS